VLGIPLRRLLVAFARRELLCWLLLSSTLLHLKGWEL
jgi:hypothetical protein